MGVNYTWQNMVNIFIKIINEKFCTRILNLNRLTILTQLKINESKQEIIRSQVFQRCSIKPGKPKTENQPEM